ncbi:hypothetical protein RSJ42_06205 [Methanosarcina hadiensis]|uniref:hypothetical protein n=1 Tax=Methanosarcina hadiensis TaxID=3078083 RepID=UPI0039773B35
MGLKILLLIALMVSVQAVAGSSSMDIKINPESMSFNLSPATSAEQSLYVTNTGNETVTYRIFVDDNTYASWFIFSPTSFDLKAGDTEEVKVTLNVPATSETDIESKIKISYTTLGKSTGTEGIIPVYIEISTSEISYSEKSSSDNSSSEGSGSSPESSNSAKVKEISQQIAANASNLVVNSRDNIIYAGENLKGSAEKWEESANRGIDNWKDTANNRIDNLENKANKRIDNLENTANNRIDNFENTTNNKIDNLKDTANKSVDNAAVSLDKVTRKFEDTSREIEDKTERYEDFDVVYEDTVRYIYNLIKIYEARILTYLNRVL